MTLVRIATLDGDKRLVVVPVPSWPSAPLPQQCTLPLIITAHVKSRPHETEITLASATGVAGGERRLVVVPSPSCPLSLEPSTSKHHQSSPHTSYQDRMTLESRPAAPHPTERTNVMWCPCPAGQTVLSPQHLTSPGQYCTAHVHTWLAPAAMSLALHRMSTRGLGHGRCNAPRASQLALFIAAPAHHVVTPTILGISAQA